MIHYCDCGKQVSKEGSRCQKCGALNRHQTKNNTRYEGTVDPKFIQPRGSKQRKKLGLDPTGYASSKKSVFG